MMSQRIFNMNNVAENINSFSSPDPISGIYILQAWNHCWATIYVNYVHRLLVVHFFCTTLYIQNLLFTCLATVACRHLKTVVIGDTNTKSVYSGIQVSAWPAALQVSAGFRRRIYDWSKTRTFLFGVIEQWQHMERSSATTAAFNSAVCVVPFVTWCCFEQF